jgi:menaquinol-cytochrome c reductase iron-sulfur subunit
VAAEHENHDLPGPSLWPVGFAVGIATLLVGLIVSTIVAVVGGILVALFGGLWIYELVVEKDVAVETTPVADGDAPEQPTGANLPAPAGGPAMPPGDKYPRSVFLEGATLGLGGVIGGLITVPVAGFAIVPTFLHQGHPAVDLGPLENFPQGEYRVATFMENPSEGEVSRRTAFIRNNGFLNKEPSFTVISNRCAHLGCPVQPGGPIDDAKAKTLQLGSNQITLIPTIPAGGFICPCHGGSYDTEGNRIAGPPVRGLDRWTFEIVNGRLVLLKTYSVAHVLGSGADAKIKAYPLAGPGMHVDGIEGWLYPVQAPH